MNTEQFKKIIWEYHNIHGRNFPWRKTTNPYYILVSEIMLQQTQVSRVVPKYRDFIRRFPTISILAQASLKEVLTYWQGLGYNRRAKMLRDAAKIIVKEYTGAIPKTPEELEALPGIGPYTARAICAFAHNTPVSFIETNIRSVYLHFFFQDKENVSDTNIISLIEKTLDVKNPRKWYCALMDYGAMLKRHGQNPNIKSKHYTKQSPFKDSNRHIRGEILKLLLSQGLAEDEIIKHLEKYKPVRISQQIVSLCFEGLLKISEKKVRIS